MSRHVAIVAAVFLALGGASARAQEKEEKAERSPKAEAKDEAKSEREAARPIRAGTTLRVQLVISRYQGEKKTGSLPYTFIVTVGGGLVRMRMGVDTPVPMGTQSPDSKAPMSFQYRNVGTNIDCRAGDLGDGRYQLSLNVENSSAMSGTERGGETPATGAPLFRRFETSLNPVLRDGQSIQTIASTDPVTGELVKIDVTLNVVK